MTYTVQPGDSLSKIAQKVYGNMSRYHEILDANPSITDEDLIYVGQVLEIPNVGTMPGPAPTPTPSPQPLPFPTQQVEKPQMTKAVLIVFALAAVALGYLVMKHFADKKSPTPTSANPDEEAGVEVVEDESGDEEVAEEEVEETV